MGYANSGLGSAMLLRKRDLSTLEDDTATFVAADIGYVLFCSVAVMIITPAIGLFYAGMLRRKSAIQILFQSYLTTAVVSIQWFVIGFSLACSTTSPSVMMGNFRLSGLGNMGAEPLWEGSSIPGMVYWIFSVFFPVATVQIFLGAIAERGRVMPSLIIGFIWTTICYCPLAYMTWAPNGWLLNLGALDFAGGGPVHIASGVASLTYSFYIGKRKGWSKKEEFPHRAHSPVTTMIGVSLIWFAWLCFNSGTLLTVNTRTAYIMANTQIAASFACFTYTVIDYLYTGKWSLFAACNGAIAGLVFITPSCGFIAPWAAAIGGIVTATVCRTTKNVNRWLGIDDTIESFNLHGLGGICGSILTAVFATPYVAGLDGVTEIAGGWIFHNWVQMGYQFAGWTTCVGWTFVTTYGTCFIVDHIPGCKLRARDEAEQMGMDLYEMAETIDEFANDYSGFSTGSFSSVSQGKVTYYTGVEAEPPYGGSSSNSQRGEIEEIKV